MKLFKKEMVTIQKYKNLFVTVDGVEHEGPNYSWAIKDRLWRRNVPEYIMIDIKSDDYVYDKDFVMYPLSNVISIEWVLVEERTVEDNFGKYDIYVTIKE